MGLLVSAHETLRQAGRLACENLLTAMKKEDGSYRTYDEMKADGIETKVQGQWVATYCADHPVDRPYGPYGAAGCGEAPLDTPHPAILNAIYNATGACITPVPAKPDVVLAALKELEK